MVLNKTRRSEATAAVTAAAVSRTMTSAVLLVVSMSCITTTPSMVTAFSVVQAPTNKAIKTLTTTKTTTTTTTSLFVGSPATTTNDFGTAMPEPETIYERLGMEEEKVAVGINPQDFLEWIGTREQVVRRFMNDMEFDRDRAEEEADKFFMDSELVNAYIKYEKNKDKMDVSTYGDYEEPSWNDPKTLATYAAWIAGGAGFSYLRRYIEETKFQTGEWQDVHVDLSTVLPKLGN